MPSTPAAITAFTLTSALGAGRTASLNALRAERSGLRRCTLPGLENLDTWVGQVDGLDDPITGSLADYDCRNHRLAVLALDQDGLQEKVAGVVRRYGAGRVGVFLGTSTSGLHHTEQSYRHHFEGGTPGLGPDLRYQHTHTNFALADFCRRRLGLAGPALVVSTACSSGAKAIAAGTRYLRAGLCDAVLVGGVDTLCATTLYGFRSLDLLSPRPAAPWGRGRTGISIGEGAGFLLLERRPTAEAEALLLGSGESSDAHHISSPHPDGEGAVLAMTAALAQAGIAPAEIDYINLHGTGTPANDRAEDRAVTRVFGPAVAASSTKGATGHALGAAGAVEAALCLACMEAGLLPGTQGTTDPDPTLELRLLSAPRAGRLRRMLSNSFGFGGSNCSLILGRP
jgi:3-oxoacyl-[acyl-carrier-protein] synthase I